MARVCPFYSTIRRDMWNKRRILMGRLYGHNVNGERMEHRRIQIMSTRET